MNAPLTVSDNTSYTLTMNVKEFSHMQIRLSTLHHRLASTVRDTTLMLLDWLIPRLEMLRLRLWIEQGFEPTEERWERPDDDDRYYREPDR